MEITMDYREYMDNPLIVNNGHFKKGVSSWNKGLTKENDRRILSSSLKLKKHIRTEEHNKNISIGIKLKNSTPWNKGKSWAKEVIQKIKENHANFSLENHPNWQGGISFLPYCIKFNKELKKSVRKRDNYTCQNPICKLTQQESLIIYDQCLDIHHIHYDKSNCYPDLITLCHSCNVKANSNRRFQEILYMNILNNRKLLFWNRGII